MDSGKAIPATHPYDPRSKDEWQCFRTGIIQEPCPFHRQRKSPVITAGRSGAGRKREWQPIEEYITIIDPGDAARQGMEKGQRINPFLNYTAIGTDFGFLGPDASMLD